MKHEINKQNQIEEMAFLICDMTSKCIDCSKHKCKSKKICIKLYNAGYRKIKISKRRETSKA